MHSRFLRPASSTNRGEMVSDATSERARQLSVEKRWSQEAPVDRARSRRLSGTVYGLRILPLPAENAPQHQRGHRQPAGHLSENHAPAAGGRSECRGSHFRGNACCASGNAKNF